MGIRRLEISFAWPKTSGRIRAGADKPQQREGLAADQEERLRGSRRLEPGERYTERVAHSDGAVRRGRRCGISDADHADAYARNPLVVIAYRNGLALRGQMGRVPVTVLHR